MRNCHNVGVDVQCVNTMGSVEGLEGVEGLT